MYLKFSRNQIHANCTRCKALLYPKCKGLFLPRVIFALNYTFELSNSVEECISH